LASSGVVALNPQEFLDIVQHLGGGRHRRRVYGWSVVRELFPAVAGRLQAPDVLEHFGIAADGGVDLRDEPFSGGGEFAVVEFEANDGLKALKQRDGGRGVLGSGYIVRHVCPETGSRGAPAAKRVVQDA